MNHTKGHYTPWRGTYEVEGRTHEVSGYFIHPRQLQTLQGIERALHRIRCRTWSESGRGTPPRITFYGQ